MKLSEKIVVMVLGAIVIASIASGCIDDTERFETAVSLVTEETTTEEISETKSTVFGRKGRPSITEELPYDNMEPDTGNIEIFNGDSADDYRADSDGWDNSGDIGELQEAEDVAEYYKETEAYIEPEYYEETYQEAYSGYTAEDFKVLGVIHWNGWTWTWYSERVLPGNGLYIPGRYSDGYFVRDGSGNICLASSDLAKGTIVATPFGQGCVYDTGCASGVLDVYVSW